MRKVTQAQHGTGSQHCGRKLGLLGPTQGPNPVSSLRDLHARPRGDLWGLLLAAHSPEYLPVSTKASLAVHPSLISQWEEGNSVLLPLQEREKDAPLIDAGPELAHLSPIGRIWAVARLALLPCLCVREKKGHCT